MVQPGREREDLARRLLQYLHRWAALLGRLSYQFMVERLPELSVPGRLAGQVPDAFHQKLRCPTSQVEHQGRRHRQGISGLFAGFGTHRYASLRATAVEIDLACMTGPILYLEIHSRLRR